MMWCTKLSGLAALVLSVLCNAGELARVESHIRKDAEQEPFESFTTVDANDPKSELFGECLAAARTLHAARLYSIEVPGTLVEYVRHVPDSYELRVPAEWKSLTLVPPVSSILECATAASDGGRPMFKYNGGDVCKGANRTYDLAYESACETKEYEAVFISTTASSPCPLPGVIHQLEPTSLVWSCLLINTDLMTMDEAATWCSGKNSRIFAQTQLTSYLEIVPVLKNLNVSTSDFFTAANSKLNGTWSWSAGYFIVDPSFMVVTGPSSADYVMYMKGSADFKFDFSLISSFKAGALCMKEHDV